MRTKYLLIFLLISNFTNFSFSAEDNLFHGLQGEALANAGEELVVIDEWYSSYVQNTYTNFFEVVSSKAKVKLWFDDALMTYYASDWQFSITYDLVLTKSDGTIVLLSNESLSIDYDPELAYNDINLKLYDDNLYIKAQLSNIQITSTLPGLIPDDIHLDLELNSERYYVLDASEVSTVTYNTNNLAATNEIEIVWSYVEGAESYDLEWLFIDVPQTSPIPNQLNAFTGNYDFKNATRVNPLTNNYKFSLAFPRGIFLFRVRPVGKEVIAGSIKRVEGSWSLSTLGNVSSVTTQERYDWQGLLPGMNWSYQSSFAEEGKKMEVLSIYDESLKPRQQVSINNSDNTALISQPIYDYLGRPTLSLLPSPEANKGLGFYPDRTKYLNNGLVNYYDYKNFDKDGAVAHTVMAPESMTGLGVNDYYTAGGGIGNSADAFIADAEGYPFSRTILKNDGTGRVKQQTMAGASVIGASDQNAGNAKTMKYYYGTPTQEELYKLFGNEVGNASHYKKNMVIDQNGQISIQYLDMSGRVIATALAGDPPTNLLQIDSYPANFEPITTDLLENNYLNDQNEYIVSKTITVCDEPSTNYVFDYSLDQEEIVDQCFISGYLYHYDLLIYITDENGVKLSIDYDGNGLATEFLYTDITSEINTDTWTVPLSTGTYTITKILSLNEDYIQTLRTAFFTNPSVSCFGSFSPITGLPCNDSSEDMCEDQYVSVDENGDRWYYDENGLLVAIISADGLDTTYQYGFIEDDLLKVFADIAACEMGAQIAVIDECAVKLDKMKTDMSPGGQYFDAMPFLSNNAPSNAWLIAERPTKYTCIDPSATSWTDIRDGWVSSYADETVKLHPEYCTYLLNCGSYSGTYNEAVIADDVPFCGSGWSGISVPEYESMVLNADPATTISGAEGYLFNPLNMAQEDDINTTAEEYQPAADNIIDAHLDPFMACRQFLKTELEDLLKEYYADGSDYHSIWYVLDDPDDIHLETSTITYSQSTIDYYQLLHGDNTPTNIGLIGNGPGQTTKYQFFKSTYQYFKNYVTYMSAYDIEIDVPACPNDPLNNPQVTYSPSYLASPANNGLTSDGYAIVYPENSIFENFSGGSTPITTLVNNQMDDQCQSQCEASADIWLNTLDDCASPADLLIMESYFIDICTISCDENYPSGSDDAGTALSGNYGWGNFSSFAAVVNHYNTNIASGGGGTCSVPEHPQPEPYNNLNDGVCECNAITEAVTQFYSSNGITIPTSFELALQLSDDQEDDLIADFEEFVNDGETFTVSLSNIQLWLNDCEAEIIPTNVIQAFQCNSIPVPDLNAFDVACGLANDVLQTNNALVAFNQVLLDGWNEFESNYYTGAWNNLDNRELFTMVYTPSEFHFTLFYYDQAGNLVKTVPPAGIEVNSTLAEGLSNADIQLCKDHLTDATQPYVHPKHTQITNYKYNSLQQLVEQTTPDGGKTIFFYDELGRLIVSQNDRQEADINGVAYSYSVYDLLGRVVEAGEITPASLFDNTTASSALAYNAWLNANGATKREVIRTIYGAYADPTQTLSQQLGNVDPNSVRNRIGSVIYQEIHDDLDNVYNNAIHYVYDELGNVKTLVDENRDAPAGAQYKRMEYIYDVISGNVQKVNYQPGAIDQFYHKYEYDANNRLTNTYTSTNNEIWEKEAKSIYYAHGPLARLEIGDKTVQAEDFVYTLNGWLKTVNSSVNNSEWDAGQDGKQITEHKYVGRDAFGFSLEYYQGDYKAVDVVAANNLTVDFNVNYDQQSLGLFNGNISKMITSISDVSENPLAVHDNAYQYDQLNRIKSSKIFKTNGTVITSSIRSSNSITSTTATNNGSYQTSYTFDGNGNLEFLTRNDNAGVLMDDFDYDYLDDKNQLRYVKDAITGSTVPVDIESGMELLNTNGADNYVYNKIGQLTQDQSEDIEIIEWTVTGKVKKIVFNDLLNTSKTTPINYIEYKYDPMDMRLSKAVVPLTGPTITTFYVYDASGNVMATYEHTENRPGEGSVPETFYLNDHHIYASKRLGVANRNIEMLISPASDEFTRVLGQKKYELANHLGNVLQVISDRKLSVDDNTDLVADYYTPDVTSYSDYYAYGMQMPGRHGTALGGNYRYGFQGQEMDDEVKGEGNSVNYKYRMHDPRVGRFFAIDPLAPQYPELTPYQFSSNNPTWYREIEGLEGEPATGSLPPASGTVEEGVEHGTQKTWAWSYESHPEQSDWSLRTLTYHGGNDYLSEGWYDNETFTYGNLDYENGQVMPATNSIVRYLSTGKSARDFQGIEVDDNGYLTGEIAPIYFDWTFFIGGGTTKGTAVMAGYRGLKLAKGLNTALIALKTSKYVNKLRYTSRYTKILSGKKASEVSDLLTSKGWSKSLPQAAFPNKTQHTVFTKTTKDDVTYMLDYHPGGGVHSVDYWKIYKVNKNGKKIVQGRIGAEGFSNYSKINNSPVFVNGELKR